MELSTNCRIRRERTMAYDTSAYDRMIDEYNRSVDQNTAGQIQKAQENANNQLKQAYIQRVQNQRNLENRLATSGIRGGATETSNLKLANQYGTSVGQINSGLASSINDINTTANQNKLAYAQEMNTKRQQYIENREAEERANAREDDLQRRQQDLDYYTAWASKFYDTKKLKKELNAAKAAGNTLKVQVLNARIGFIKSHKKGY